MCVVRFGNMIEIRIREIAERKGYKNANQLGAALEVAPNVASRLWNGQFEMVGVGTLDKLCRVLRCQPGKLLYYRPDSGNEPS